MQPVTWLPPCCGLGRRLFASGRSSSPKQRFRQQPGEMTMMLEPQSLIVWLVIGLIAGWLAGQIVKGYGLGLVGNLVVGVVGHSSAVGSSASSTSISAAESFPQSSTLPLAQWCSWSLSVFSNGHSAVRVASRLRLVKAGATGFP